MLLLLLLLFFFNLFIFIWPDKNDGKANPCFITSTFIGLSIEFSKHKHEINRNSYGVIRDTYHVQISSLVHLVTQNRIDFMYSPVASAGGSVIVSRNYVTWQRCPVLSSRPVLSWIQIYARSVAR